MMENKLDQVSDIHVCLLCGCSIAQRQSDKILRDNPNELQQSMIDIIKNRVAPRQVTASDRVCHACWLRTQREVRRMHRVESERIQRPASDVTDQEESSVVDEVRPHNVENESITQNVVIPGYKRAANSNRRCVFPDCSQTTLRSISDQFRAILIKDYRFYLPNLARVCDDHLNSNMWDTLYEADNSISSFSTDQIAHVFSFVNTFNVSLDLENPLEMDDRIFYYWFGYTKETFSILHSPFSLWVVVK
ncbi:hypothetical protein ACJJTC_016818 [Scirpophaga incertulas]